ncbi:MAG: hypothetical protein NC253_04000 [Ruminococcus sp.]|nr:hypothetical protein [Ruminococcus sp.]MCM1381145.1 hypothetical protein [Muribaculaceae bacterium]MCM1478822.1 hypothetical protein [Muribaculaceae bacterium]
MKIFPKNLTSEDEKIFGKVIVGLTFILLACSAVMSWFGFYADFNLGAVGLLGLLWLIALCFGKGIKRDIRNVFLAVLAVSDALYVIILFFLLGRAFMRNLM